MKYLNTVVVFVLLMCGAMAAGDRGNGDPSRSFSPDSYAGATRPELEAAMERLSSDRATMQDAVLDCLEDDKRPNARIAAIYISGLYRLEKTAPILAGNISYLDDKVGMASRLPLWSQYPATDALARIGIEAVPELVNNLATSDDAKVQELSILVLESIEGSRVAKFVLEEAVAAPANAAKPACVARLKHAIVLLTQIP